MTVAITNFCHHIVISGEKLGYSAVISYRIYPDLSYRDIVLPDTDILNVSGHLESVTILC